MDIKDYKENQLRFFKKYWYILVIIGLTGIVTGIIQSNEDNKKADDYANIYPYYNTANFFSGIVMYLQDSSKRYRNGGGIEFKLNDEKGYTLGWAVNNTYYPSELSDFVQVGDSINKACGSDSVLIYRNGDVYCFVISKRINREGNYY